ncbi:MAG: alpha/beta hydrolase [Chloroflexi bacterium]|nr:alpha/beta hydrolase [Chloroflexota bacterium]MCC6894916.1 alpha/beta hydrolase [Anaerolineae bacterium]
MTKQTGFAPVNGTQMYYEIAGSGHPLIMVHAGVADNRLWDHQFDLFAEQYHVIRFDQRGFGQTKPVDGDFNRSEDIYALLTHLGINHAYLMGCSMGGGACIDFALTHPEMAKALITIGSGPGGFKTDDPPPAVWGDLVKAYEADELDKVAEYEAQIWLDGPAAPAGRVGGAIREKMIAMNSIALHNEKLELGKEIPLASPAVNRLSELHLPALIIYGDLDTPYVQTAGKYLADHIAGAKRVIMSGVAHLPSMEQPAALNKIVLEFLAALP